MANLPFFCFEDKRIISLTWKMRCGGSLGRDAGCSKKPDVQRRSEAAGGLIGVMEI
jgi:hypothetical protein